MKHVYGNQDDCLLPIIPVPMRRILCCGGSISRPINPHGTVFGRYRVRALEKIDHGGTVLVTMYADIAAGFYRKDPQAQLAALHALDFRPKINSLFHRRLESLVVLRNDLP